MIFPEPGHSYQLKPLGLDNVPEPVIAKVHWISLFGLVSYTYKPPEDTYFNIECRLSDFVLMIDKKVDVEKQD